MASELKNVTLYLVRGEYNQPTFFEPGLFKRKPDGPSVEVRFNTNNNITFNVGGTYYQASLKPEQAKDISDWLKTKNYDKLYEFLFSDNIKYSKGYFSAFGGSFNVEKGSIPAQEVREEIEKYLPQQTAQKDGRRGPPEKQPA